MAEFYRHRVRTRIPADRVFTRSVNGWDGGITVANRQLPPGSKDERITINGHFRQSGPVDFGLGGTGQGGVAGGQANFSSSMLRKMMSTRSNCNRFPSCGIDLEFSWAAEKKCAIGTTPQRLGHAQAPQSFIRSGSLDFLTNGCSCVD